MSEIKIPAQGIASLSYDPQEVHIISVGLLSYLAEHDLEVSVATLSLILSLGRLLSVKELTEEEEHLFLQFIMEQVGLYFAEGAVN